MTYPSPAPQPSLRRPTRRRVLAGGAGLAVLLLGAGGCSVLHLPEADDALQAMRGLAARDSAVLPGHPGEVRLAHAEALGAEITRSCGVREDGTRPEGCGDAPGAPAPAGGDPVGELTDSRGHASLLTALDGRRTLSDAYECELAAAVDGGIVLALRSLDVDWEDLVPDPAAAVAESGEGLSGDDADLLAAALEAEYALVYGMGVAAPRIADDLRVSAGTSADRHRILRDRVIALLEDAGEEVPAAAPGYAVAAGAPDPDADAAGFARHLERTAAEKWRAVLAGSRTPALRLAALQAAGLSQAGAAVFAGDGTAALPGLGG
ncbi:DUF4439 domain-containing protein [Corynebacterium sp. 335C]